MAFPTFFPLRLKRTRKCERCGLRRPVKAEACPHCAELDDRELAELRERVEQEHEGAAELGRMMAIAAAVILGVMILLALL